MTTVHTRPSIRSVLRRMLRIPSLLRLQPCPHHLVWVCRSTRNDFAKKDREGETKKVSALIFMGSLCADFHTSKSGFEYFVQRKLNGNMREPDESRCETGVEGTKTFAFVHLDCGVEGISVMPWRFNMRLRTWAWLGHQPGFNDPYWICCECWTCARC